MILANSVMVAGRDLRVVTQGNEMDGVETLVSLETSNIGCHLWSLFWDDDFEKTIGEAAQEHANLLSCLHRGLVPTIFGMVDAGKLLAIVQAEENPDYTTPQPEGAATPARW